VSFRTLDDLPADLRGKRVLLRADLNLPMREGRVADATRLDALLPTIAELLSRGAAVLLLSHFGRPEGRREPSMSLAPVAAALGERLAREVRFVPDCVGPEAEEAAAELRAGEVALLENLRFHAGEEANDPGFADRLARLGHVFVNDAFSAAHRAHASTEGLARRLPAFAGRAMEAEVKALQSALGTPRRPVMAVVGGAKVSTKIDVLTNLVARVEHLAIGGAMANSFLAARGIAIGRSLAEHDQSETVRAILARAEEAGCTVHLPYEVVVARELAPGAPHRIASVRDVGPEEMILDLGPAAVEALGDVLKGAATLVWNGPLGAFEVPPFDAATLAFARMATAQTAAGALVSVVGGGDTVAAINRAGLAGAFSHVSTAGGAFLEWMEGRTLPGVAALEAAIQSEPQGA
jgi:phosphoglycerate kinase